MMPLTVLKACSKNSASKIAAAIRSLRNAIEFGERYQFLRSNRLIAKTHLSPTHVSNN